MTEKRPFYFNKPSEKMLAELPPELRGPVERLHTTSFEAIRKAAKEIAKINHPKATEWLIRVVKEAGNPATTIEAAEHLANRGDKEAIKAIAERMEEESWISKNHYFVPLAKLGYEEIRPVLVKGLKSDHSFTRIEAAKALWEFRDTTHTPLIIKALANNHKNEVKDTPKTIQKMVELELEKNPSNAIGWLEHFVELYKKEELDQSITNGIVEKLLDVHSKQKGLSLLKSSAKMRKIVPRLVNTINEMKPSYNAHNRELRLKNIEYAKRVLEKAIEANIKATGLPFQYITKLVDYEQHPKSFVKAFLEMHKKEYNGKPFKWWRTYIKQMMANENQIKPGGRAVA